MVLEFKGDAIVLSGETGTKLKSEIIGDYYQLWWEITSGGPNNEYRNQTTIIEMNSGSGEDYISETNETILGSSGHALQLKGTNFNTSNLAVITVEENPECYEHLKKVIARRWNSLQYATKIEEDTKDSIYLLNDRLQAFDIVHRYRLGNSLFFFDPLLFVQWAEIEEVAQRRIKKYYQSGTEFIIFLFTSDWFLGRGELTPLPTINNEQGWNSNEKEAVSKADKLFGNQDWRSFLLQSKSKEDRIQMMVRLYRDRLHKWFRYVLPLPFEPKKNQTYHLFMCSNYEAGVEITRRFYTKYTNNPKYSPSNEIAYSKFIGLHAEKKMKGKSRSSEWKILWAIIKEHDEGLCDVECRDLIRIQPESELLKKSLLWLVSKGYIKKINQMTDTWNNVPDLYRLDWNFVKEKLDVPSPPELKPMESKRV
ncbi:MAG: three-Cys-motif partner protein TcmP [Thaumarchaeota archaeon]|nr:three-Cys-motif partner protein TcmP [Nitrososphaerota archaeon]